MYVGRVWLGYTDEQVWMLTPRQFDAQLKVHEDVVRKTYGVSTKGSASQATSGYIDQIPGW